jgi:hypothetical protein
MGFFDLFKKREAPLQTHEDETLGAMVWSEEDEGWKGECDAIAYIVAYEGLQTPPHDLVLYARETLANRGEFRAAVESAKKIAVSQHPKLAEQITALKIGTACFYRYKNVRRILADLNGGQGDRSWRVEFTEDQCEGIGFDT